MGDHNQRDWILANRKRVVPPILEIGSKDYGGGSTKDYRTYFPTLAFTGIDRAEGKGVDVVCDFTWTTDRILARIPANFRTALCLSVMEHCAQSFQMAANIAAVLKPGAVLFLSVPWVWHLHGFPEDYWRFTPAAIQVLFPDFTVDAGASHWSTKNRGEWERWKLEGPQQSFYDPQKPEHPYYFYPMMLNMLLVKK